MEKGEYKEGWFHGGAQIDVGAALCRDPRSKESRRKAAPTSF